MFKIVSPTFQTGPFGIQLRQHAKLRITGRQLKQPNIRKTMLLKNIAFLVRSDRGWVCQNLVFGESKSVSLPGTHAVEIMSLPLSDRPV
jgi:hypothetical protein